MKYDTKVRIAEIFIILVMLGTVVLMAYVMTSYFVQSSKSTPNEVVNNIQKQALVNSTQNDKNNQNNGVVQPVKEPTDPSYLKHKKFLVENDCWVILVVRYYESANFHYQCLKAPNYYTYRSIYYYPTRDYYNHIEGMTEVERLQKQIAVNKQIKPNYFERAY